MGEANLLPCPFCGGSDLDVDDYGKVVWCCSCKTMGPRPVDWPEVTSGPAAIDRWNRRADIGEVVNAAWRKANLLGIELAEERVISEARERANVAARERIAELEERMAAMTGRAPKLVVKDAETGREIQVLGLNAEAPLEEPMLVMVPVDRKGPPV